MRLIDADALAMHMADWQLSACSEQYDTIEEAIDAVTSAPTIEPKRGEWIDAVPVRHGHWVESFKVNAPPTLKERWICSWCGDVQTYGETRYCPNCGARMDGEK